MVVATTIMKISGARFKLAGIDFWAPLDFLVVDSCVNICVFTAPVAQFSTPETVQWVMISGQMDVWVVPPPMGVMNIESPFAAQSFIQSGNLNAHVVRRRTLPKP